MSTHIIPDAYVYELSLGDEKPVIRSYRGYAVGGETSNGHATFRFIADDILADLPKVMEPMGVYRSTKDPILGQKLFVLVLDKNDGLAITIFKDYLILKAESAVSTAQTYINYISSKMPV